MMQKNTICLLLISLYFGSVKHGYCQIISTGGEFSLVQCSDGTAMGFGYDKYGTLGDGSAVDKYFPVQVTVLTNLKDISAGGTHSLFLKYDGSVWACGNNGWGQLGIGTISDTNSTPVKITSLSNIIAISAGSSFSLFLKSDGTVWSCGYNYKGQLGDSSQTTSPIPVKVKGLSGIIGISAGISHSLFLKNDGTVWSCGSNFSGELGDGTLNMRTVPGKVKIISNVKKIQAGGSFSSFLKYDGTVWSCGSFSNGQLGNGANSGYTDTVILINNLPYISDISAGMHHQLFLTNNSSVWTCGYNNTGQLGNGNSGSSADVMVPALINGLNNIKKISAGRVHSLFLKSDATVLVCGSNYNGELGTTTTSLQATPIIVNGLCLASLSVQELSAKDIVTVSPNPFSTQTTISIEDAQFYGMLNLKIYDIAGKEVKQESFSSNSYVIKRDRLENGLYFYHITCGDHLIASGKLIILE